MPGGSTQSYETLGPILTSIAAIAEGEPCVTHVGTDGAGHFVKMVHNGIEYADMQLIAEAYDLIRQGTGKSPAEIADIFAEWNTGELESYLIEITAEVLRQVDAATGEPLVDVILDEAGAKGTGAWTVQNALDLGVPDLGHRRGRLRAQPLVEARPARGGRPTCPAPSSAWTVDAADADAFIEDVRRALYASKIIAYSQGFDEIIAGAEQFGWDINKGDIAKIWRAGCIIRARFLNRIAEAYAEDPGLVAARRRAVLPRRRRRRAGELAPRRRRSRRSRASRRPRSRRRSRTTTASAPSACPPRSCRASATSSARTPTSASTSRASSTRCGRATAARSRRRPRRTSRWSGRRRGASGCRSRRGDVRAPSPTTGSRCANERTFLAWIRTALALLAGGVLLHQFATELGPRPAVIVLSVGLGVVAAVLSVVSYTRWRAQRDRDAAWAVRCRSAGVLPTLAGACLLASAVLVVLLLIG